MCLHNTSRKGRKYYWKAAEKGYQETTQERKKHRGTAFLSIASPFVWGFVGFARLSFSIAAIILWRWVLTIDRMLLTREHWVITVTVPLCQPHVSHGLTIDWTRPFAMTAGEWRSEPTHGLQKSSSSSNIKHVVKSTFITSNRIKLSPLSTKSRRAPYTEM